MESGSQGLDLEKGIEILIAALRHLQDLSEKNRLDKSLLRRILTSMREAAKLHEDHNLDFLFAPLLKACKQMQEMCTVRCRAAADVGILSHKLNCKAEISKAFVDFFNMREADFPPLSRCQPCLLWLASLEHRRGSGALKDAHVQEASEKGARRHHKHSRPWCSARSGSDPIIEIRRPLHRSKADSIDL